MRICITINDVIRNFYKTFEEVYKIYEEEEEIFEENIDNFEYGLIGEDGEVQPISNVNFEKKILNLDGLVDPMYITSKIPFQSEQTFLSFLYEKMAFEINAKTNLSYSDVMKDLNNIILYCSEKGLNVDLVSIEKANSRPATLFFLSREKCKVNNIKFVNDYSEIWEDYNIVITAENYLIENKKNRRKLFKIETDNNIHLKQGISCKNLKEVLNHLKNNDKSRSNQQA